MDHEEKVRRTVDALFGDGAASALPRGLEMSFSRSGRLRGVLHGGELLCTVRPDGGLAITMAMARMLASRKKFRENCVVVDGEAAPFVRDGRSVFARHVTWCGGNVRVGSETPVLHRGRVIAVGRAALSAAMIRDFGRGVAVRVR
ncbi:conserved hypothetical protein [Nitrosopumilaceae archaeon]|nr:queuine tRNA-ribosyltransferase [Nitrosopumilus sp.]CAI9830935.1 conserved hypothetical protein [Nitrosopumilaceae archaeon]MDA7944902.1 queuine tRNA-ribosyltransferase [Nitrosopumilus sp.]MDA7955502.1 queuine tRNA-ribosyltransferase [Nitrosopumilus sp.]MDA7974466.1 queuine tRNA-ribosyltransferase [Nitrosopumilus sp.]